MRTILVLFSILALALGHETSKVSSRLSNLAPLKKDVKLAKKHDKLHTTEGYLPVDHYCVVIKATGLKAGPNGDVRYAKLADAKAALPAAVYGKSQLVCQMAADGSALPYPSDEDIKAPNGWWWDTNDIAAMKAMCTSNAQCAQKLKPDHFCAVVKSSGLVKVNGDPRFYTLDAALAALSTPSYGQSQLVCQMNKDGSVWQYPTDEDVKRGKGWWWDTNDISAMHDMCKNDALCGSPVPDHYCAVVKSSGLVKVNNDARFYTLDAALAALSTPAYGQSQLVCQIMADGSVAPYPSDEAIKKGKGWWWDTNDISAMHDKCKADSGCMNMAPGVSHYCAVVKSTGLKATNGDVRYTTLSGALAALSTPAYGQSQLVCQITQDGNVLQYPTDEAIKMGKGWWWDTNDIQAMHNMCKNSAACMQNFNY